MRQITETQRKLWEHIVSAPEDRPAQFDTAEDLIYAAFSVPGELPGVDLFDMPSKFADLAMLMCEEDSSRAYSEDDDVVCGLEKVEAFVADIMSSGFASYIREGLR